MNNPFIGQVTLFAGNFAPRAYAFCQGQLLPISSNTALFSILGTIYGGDGRTTFALPDLRGRCAIHPGRGPGLSTYVLGERQGIERVNLNLLQLPSHNHVATFSGAQASLLVNSGDGDSNEPGGKYLAKAVTPAVGPVPANVANMYSSTTDNTTLAVGDVVGNMAVNNSGGSQSHENRRPFIAINYIIALQGTYPSRS